MNRLCRFVPHLRRGPLWAAPLVFLFLGACAGTPQTDRVMSGDVVGLPDRVLLEEVPFVPQEDLWCGPATMAMVMTWSGLPVTQEEMAAQVYTPGREGTLTTDMISAARRNGRLAVEINSLEDLLAELAAGHPVIVFQNLALDLYPQWHYAVAIGYDLQDGRILLHSGLEELRATRLTTFERTWQRADHWALVVLPPDRLPASADALRIAAAAAGIERAGNAQAAETAYRAVLSRWPANAMAWLGLGNLAYGAGDLANAQVYFREATLAGPELGAAWNNLAVVLGETGDKPGALAAARRAIATGDGDQETYRTTLAEIEALP